MKEKEMNEPEIKIDDEPSVGPTKNSKKTIIVSTIILAIVILLAALFFCALIDQPHDTGIHGEAAYTKEKGEIENAVTGYSANNSRLGQFPKLSGNIAINGTTYYVIDFSQLVMANGGLMKTYPTSLASVGIGNDNCNGAGSACKSSNHYIWYVDDVGNIISRCTGKGCTANDADGYQGVWP